MRIAWVLGFCGLLSSGTALAQSNVTAENEPTHFLPDSGAGATDMREAEQDHEARELFQQGRQAYEDGNYRDAWDYFRKAYILSRRPALLYNVGQSADRLGLDAEALQAFRMYLRDAPEADNRREVENRVRALEQRVQRQREAREASGETVEEIDEDDESFLTDGVTTEDGELSLAAPPEPTVTERDGWYLRGALGLSGFFDTTTGGGEDRSISGGGLALDAAAGLPVHPTLVVGGVLVFAAHPGASRDDGVALEQANVLLLGPFVDYYPAPESGPWHLHAALTFGRLDMARTTAEGDVIGTEGANVGAIIVGGAYDWRWDDQWAIGAMARLALGQGTESDVIEHRFATLSLGATATWF